MTSKNAVVLFSGGLDSTTVLAYAQSKGFNCHAISFSYGQAHQAELEATKRIAKQLNVAHHQIITLNPNMFAPSALTHAAEKIADYSGSQETPATYVPARNTIFLAICLGYAENISAQDIFFGGSQTDYCGYPDCRPEFVKAFEQLANKATKAGVSGNPYHIHAPLIHQSKAQTILLGRQLGVDFSLTVSCYRADSVSGAACGKCDSCVLRRKGFEEAGIVDPTKYIHLY